MDLKVGIVGCGNIASKHLGFITRFISKDKIALCDKDELRLDDFSKRTGIGRKYSTLEKMILDFHPDIVHILTPPSTHKDIAIKCLKEGCHVLIEKPMCVSTEEADEIIRVAHEHKRLVCVDHMRLFDPLFIKAKEILNSGKIGEITNISVCYSYDLLNRIHLDASSRWKNQLPGGAFFDIMPHVLCLLEDFMPDIRVKSVSIKTGSDSITDLWCIFKSSSATGSLHMSINIFPLQNYVVFECTQGILKVDFRNFLLIFRKQNNLPNAVERVFGNLSEGVQILRRTFSSVLNFLRGRLDPYAGLGSIIKRFYSAIINNGESPVPPEKAKKLLSLTEEIFSLKSKVASMHSPIPNSHLESADVLVTGGTGFIGRHLVSRLLKKGYKVRLLTRQNLNDKKVKSLFKSNNIEIIRGDIYDYKSVETACKGIDTVYHLAAATQGDWNYHLDTTITGTKNILEASIKTGVKHMVYVSTLNVYNATRYPLNGFVDEDFSYEDLPEKRGNYSHAKLKAEKIVREYMKQDKMSISILRPGLVYGPGGRIFSPDVGYKIGKKMLIVLGGRKRLPLVYIDNLVDALVLAGELKERARGVFNVVDDDYPTQREFIKTYKKFTNDHFLTIYLPMPLLYCGFWVLDQIISIFFKKPPSFTYKLKCVNKRVRYSTKRIEDNLGWRQKINFVEGLKFTVGSLNNKKW